MNQLLPALIAAAIPLLGTLVALWVTRRKNEADTATATTGQLIEGWADQAKTLRAEVAELRARQDVLESENEEAKRQRDDANRTARELEVKLQNDLHLLAEYARYTSALIAHISAGNPPPPPPPSWLIANHMNNTKEP